VSDAGERLSSSTTTTTQSTEPLAYRAVRGGFWSVVGSYFTIGFGFIANIALIRLLTPAIYGEFALAMFFVTLFDLVGKSGLNYAFAHHRTVNGETLGTLLVLGLLMGAGSLVLAILSAPILLTAGYAPMVPVIIAATIAVQFTGIWLWPFAVVLESELRFKPLAVATSIAMVLSYIPAFGLALSGQGQYSLLVQSLTNSLLAMAAMCVYLFRAQRHLLQMRWRYSPTLARRFLRFGLTTGLGNFISTLLVHVDNFILGTLAGTTVLGYYDRAYRVAQWPSTLLIPLVGRAAVFTYNQLRDDQARLQRSVTMVLWTSANLAIPIALALFFSAPELVPLLFGAQWTPAVPLLRILLAVSVLRPVWENAWALLIGLGLPRRVVELSLFQLAVLIVLGTVLTWLFSAAGTATAVMVMLLCGLGLAYLRIKPKLALDLPSAFGGPLAALILAVIGYLVLVRVIGNELPLWAAVAWKASWAVIGFGLSSVLIQPKQFAERMLYIWRLWRRRSPANSELSALA
jgi:lipopolysaccharide exporter